VFIGEQGLDITQVTTGYNAIAWWPSAAIPGINAPTAIVDVTSRKTNMVITSAEFVGYSGTWYVWDGSNPVDPPAVFQVVDPSLGISVWDPETSIDETGKSVARGSYLTFRISTNMYHVAEGYRKNAPGDLDQDIDIIVKDTFGGSYTQLYNSGLSPQSLSGQFPNSYPYYSWGGDTVPSLWATGVSSGGLYMYQTGTYTFYAVSTLNSMKDNYKNGGADYTGKTISATETVTLVGDPGTITATSVPSGATIWIDDFLTGAKTDAVLGISPGSHTVRVSVPGYSDQTQVVNVVSGANTNAIFSLLPFTSALNPPPIVSGIIPANGTNAGIVAITDLSGTNFAPSNVDVTLTPANLVPSHKGSLTDGAGGAALSGSFDLYVAGNYAYVTSMGGDALEIVDISNPAVPVHKGKITNGNVTAPYLNNPWNVFVAGNYAYVVSDSNALEIIDISNPAAPVHKGSIVNGAGGANLYGPIDVFVKDNYAYVTSAGGYALEIVDVSNPAAPVHTAALTSGFGGARFSQPWAIYVAGNYAYITSTMENSLEIVDISDPTNPYHEGSIKNGDGGALLDTPDKVFVSGNYAYVSSGYSNALEIVDVSNPAAPVHAGSIVNGVGGALLDSPRDVYVHGNYAYVASYTSNALEIVDVSNPAAPVHAGSIVNGVGGALLERPLSVYPLGDFAYVTGDSDALEIVDIGTITGTGVNVVSGGNQITCTLDLSGKATGPYNVVVTNPGGSGFSSLADGFAVTSPSSTGSIAVNSTPAGATIYLDNVIKGTTPATLLNVPAGPHTVKLTLPTYFDVVRPVTVPGGGIALVSVSMDLIPVVLTPNAKNAVQATITNILLGDTSGVEVSVINTDTLTANPVINVWPGQPQIAFTKPGIISYIDLMPEANDAHPGKFVNTYTDPVDGKLKTETQNTNSPATKINGNPVVFTHGAGVYVYPGDVNAPNDPPVWKPTCTVNCGNYYALLISGGTDKYHNYVRYWNDLSYMYNVLIENNFDTNKIKVLMSDGLDHTKDRRIAVTAGNPDSDFDDSPWDLSYPASAPDEVNAAGTAQNMKDYLDKYAPSGSTPLTSSNTLFIFTTGHGSLVSGTSKDDANINFNLWNNDYISDADFATKLKAIQAGNIIVVMEQCNGGGLYDNWIKGYTGSQNRTLIYAASWDEPSWGNGFSDAWTSGLAGHLRGGLLDKSADTLTVNERVSIQESKDYVLKVKSGQTLPNDRYATTSTTPVKGKERPGIFSAGAKADPTTQYLNDCTGTLTSSITTVTPTAPATWKQGSHQTISWQATALAGRIVKLYLQSSGGTQYPIVSCSPGVDAEKTASVGWYVPSGTGTGVPPPAGGYKVKVATCSGTSVIGTSAGTVTIGAAETRDGWAKITTNPTDSIRISWDGTDLGQVTIPYTRTDKEGKYSVIATRDGYYPYSATVTITALQTNTLLPWNMELKPTGQNGEDLDPTPLGGVLVNSDQDPSLVWIGRWISDSAAPSGFRPPNMNEFEHPPNLDTPTLEPKWLEAGFSYDIYVTKDGFKPSAKQTVYIQTRTPYRVPVNLFFHLEPEQPPVPARVLIVPQILNIGRTGYFLAFVKLPSGYKAADVVEGSVSCEGAPAIRLIRVKLFPQIFVAIFNRKDLQNVQLGDQTMDVVGTIRKSGGNVLFGGSDTIKVTNKKVTTKEDVDSVMTLTDTQIFTKFNKF
jgi:hypothetical protein